ncbi:MAG TPA: hypothetical protein VGJ20_38310 [Xanthobacteraceae bacterium]|jgi:hypothetical protein
MLDRPLSTSPIALRSAAMYCARKDARAALRAQGIKLWTHAAIEARAQALVDANPERYCVQARALIERMNAR